MYINGMRHTPVTLSDDLAASSGITNVLYTIPLDVTEGDTVQCIITATVGGVVASSVVRDDQVVSNYASDVYSRIGAPNGASLAADVATRASQASVSAIPTTPLLAANYTAPDNAGIGTILTRVTGPVALDSTVAKASAVAAIPTTQMTESYPAKGAAPTIEQALCLILALLGEKSISGSTLTVNSLDGATPAATFGLTVDADPQPFKAITRAT